MLGIPREVAEHTLKIHPGSKPVKQRLRRFNEEKRRAIGEEITKLLAAGFNKACPKDPFPLSRIDQIVDSTSGCETLCFLDAYSGYHQIVMRESDQLATSFITPFGSFCYISMPFGLKNTGATYQRCMLNCFGDLIGRTVEAYDDDIVVQSKRADHLVTDLAQTFAKLWANCIKLNPEKCVFGVPRGMLLGFIIFEPGIEANLEKILAITRMGPIQNIKGV